MANPRLPRNKTSARRLNANRSVQLYEGPDLAGRPLPNSSSPGAPALTVMPGFRTLAQNPFLPTSLSNPAPQSAHRNGEWEEDSERASTPMGSFPEGNYATSSPIRFEFHGLEGIEKRYWSDRYANKKARQWGRWASHVIPSLLNPYLDYLAQTAQGRSLPTPPPCVCGLPVRKLEVVAVYWESKCRPP